MIWWILGLSVLSGIFYRFGGIGKPFKSWHRDWICPLIALIALWLLIGFKLSYWWAYLISYVAMGGALTTYWDDLFGGEDNYYMHGFMIGLACFTLFWAGIHWWAILIRAIVLGASIGLWSHFWDWDDAEEFGRGFFIPITMYILLT